MSKKINLDKNGNLIAVIISVGIALILALFAYL